MNVYRAPELNLKGIRTFPWLTSFHDANCRYHDFKQHPELIESSLEDFLPWSAHPAIQQFYDLLRWLNGPTSELETDDCAFGGVKLNNTQTVTKDKQADGRIMLFYRRLQQNCVEVSARWLMECFEFYLKRVKTDLQLGVIGISKATTFFNAIQQQGVSLILNFWAWGNSDQEVMNNLAQVFRGLFEASQLTSAGISENLNASGSTA